MLQEKPHNREIIWIYDPIGGIGKSVLCKHLGSDTLVLTSTNEGDINFILSQFSRAKIIVFDLARKSEKFMNYRTLENIKNGYVTSTKYESKNIQIDIPHLVVFANFFCERKELSSDRWNILVCDPEMNYKLDNVLIPYDQLDELRISKMRKKWKAYFEEQQKLQDKDNLLKNIDNQFSNY